MTGEPPRVIATQRVYDGRVVSLRVDTVQDADGRVTTREVVEHHGAVAVVPMLADDEVLLITQYRHAVGEWLLEIPAGTLEVGEDPEECALRELQEETGYTAARLSKVLSVYVSPGYCDELIHIYVAEQLAPGVARPEVDEVIQQTPVKLRDIPELIALGKIRDGKTVAALLAVLAERE